MNAVHNAFYAAEFDYFESEQMRGSEILVRSGSVIKTVWKNPQSARYTPSLSGKDARLADAWQNEDDSGVVFVEIIGSAEQRPLDITLHLNPKGEVRKPPEPLVMPLFFMNEGSEGDADEPTPPVTHPRPPTSPPPNPVEPPVLIELGPDDDLRKAIEGKSGEVTIVLEDKMEFEGSVEIQGGVSLTIKGGGKEITRSNPAESFFKVESGSSLTLVGITLNGENAKKPPVVVSGENAVLTLGDGAVISSNGYDFTGTGDRSGVMVENGGTLIMDGNDAKIITSSFWGMKGVVYVAPNSHFKLIKGEISGNFGGGYVPGVYNDGTFTMSGGTISGNRSLEGGGVYNNGTFEMTGGTISGNRGGNGGGGVLNNGTFTMTGGTISENSAYQGGGVYNKGTFEMTGGTISGNRNNWEGPSGVYNNGTFSKSDEAEIDFV